MTAYTLSTDVLTVRNLLALVAGYYILRILRYTIYKPLTSPLRKLKCPEGGDGIMGHFSDIVNLYNWDKTNNWISTCGPTFAVNGPFWIHQRLWTIDHRAISHIMNNTSKYPKPEMLRRAIWRYLREGLILAEGERHKIQRKVVQRLFSRSSLNSFGRIIQDKADQVSDILNDLSHDPSSDCPYASPLTTENQREIDMYALCARVTYDLIGEVAIDHKFDSTSNWHGAGAEMFEKYERMQQICEGSTGIRSMLSTTWPWLDKIWPTENSRRVEAAMNPLEELSKETIAARRSELADGKREKLADRDLLTLMLRVNASEETPQDQKMTEAELTGQLATFMFAGSETTAGTMAWAFLQLAMNPSVQDKLRQECLAYGDHLPFDQIDSLPYLDAVSKEALRCNPSLPGTVREAKCDDLIPLTEPITLQNGVTVSEIPIRKGQLIHIPIDNMHMAKSIWGPDAYAFKPERWYTPTHISIEKEGYGSGGFPEGKRGGAPGIKDGPGVWPNMMSFIDGTRRCVGYKLAMMEIKITIFTMVKHFVLMPVEGKRIYKWNMFSTRPYVAGELFTKGSSMPIIVKPYRGS